MLMLVVIMPWASKRTKVESHRQLLQTVRMSWSTDADQSYTKLFPSRITKCKSDFRGFTENP
jgi:hypothetical protein